MLDAIEAVIGTSAKFMLFTGAPPSNCGAAVTGTKITEFDLAASRSQRSSTRGRAKKVRKPLRFELSPLAKQICCNFHSRLDRSRGWI
jgi:hypothetical protein